MPFGPDIAAKNLYADLSSIDSVMFMVNARTRDKETEQCIDDCLECHAICTDAILYCIGMGERHAAPNHIRILSDCSRICIASADFILQDSDYVSKVCDLCDEICDKCAESCEEFSGDKVMQECAVVCRRCADSCAIMAQKKGLITGA